MKNALLLSASLLLSSVTAMAGPIPTFDQKDPVEKALAIAYAMDRHDIGYQDEICDVELININTDGKEQHLFAFWRYKEGTSDGDKRFYVFREPSNMQGSAVLSYGHIDRPDEHWLYLPAANRMVNVRNENRSSSYAGSEFTYQDINSQEVPKFSYRYLREDMLDGRKMHVAERVAKDPNSGYSKQVIWVDMEELHPVKIESFDLQGKPLKTSIVTGWKVYNDQYWRQGQITLTNHKSGKVSKLIFTNRVFKTGLTEEEFSLEAFARGENRKLSR